MRKLIAFIKQPVTILMASVMAIVVVMAGIAFAFDWYKAGLQRDVYKRQGIEMTRWECLLGIKPAEMVVDVKEKK